MTVGLPARERLAWVGVTIGTAAVLCGCFYLVRESRDGLWSVALAVAIMAAATLGFELRRVRRAKGWADRANMAKSRFLNNISEEIRTPMDGIVGMTDLLLLSRLTKEQQEYAATVQNSASALLKVLNDMLDYSRIIDGQVLFTSSDFELHELIDNVVERYASVAQEKSVNLTCHISPNVPEVVCGDAVRLQQVIDQLVSNAVKFTPQGRICVCARWLGDVNDKHLIQINVSDTGVGLRDRQRAQVFDSYSAVRSVQPQQCAGGMGLAIAKQIVTRAHGSIDFESNPGRGTTFWVVLPFGRSSIKVPHATKPSPLAGKHVLIASPLNCFCNMAVDYCRSFGMTTIQVDSSDKLTEALRGDQSIHVAIVDDEIARAAAKNAFHVPVVIIPQAGRTSQGHRVLQRPVRRRTFELTLIQLLNEQQTTCADEVASSLKLV